MIKKLLKNEFVKGSLFLFIGANFLNFFNFLFHFIVGRMIGVADYSVVAAIVSMAYIFSIPTEAIQTIISKYTVKFSKSEKKINNLLVKSLKKFFFISLVCFIIFISFSTILGSLMHISYRIIIFSGLMIFGIFLMPIGRGVLQGKKRFRRLGLSFFIEGFIKVFGAVALIMLGLRVYGAIGGIILSLTLSLLLVIYFIKDYLKIKSKREGIKGIYSYSYPTLISLGAIILFYSLDVLLAKIFFSPVIAGQYAIISLFGKSVFFASSPISKAMFPLMSETKDKKKRADLIKKSIIMILGIALIGILFFGLLGGIIIRFMGSDFSGLEKFIWLPAIAMTFLALTNLFVYYNLAVDKLKRNLYLIGLIILEVTLLYFFRSSVINFMIALIVSNAITFIFYLFAYLRK